MTDPVGVSQDPRPVLMMGDELDMAADLMELADDYAIAHRWSDSADARARLESAIRAALEAQP